MSTQFQYNDGGRAEAGFKGNTGDCVCRAICIVTGLPYRKVYTALAAGNASQRKGKRGDSKAGVKTASKGINTNRKWFDDYMASLGFVWTPTMLVGQGCKVHLCSEELPSGKLVVAVSKHFTAVIDGVINDTHNPAREVHCVEPDNGQELKTGQWRNVNGICSIRRRCVYGYYSLKNTQPCLLV